MQISSDVPPMTIDYHGGFEYRHSCLGYYHSTIQYYTRSVRQLMEINWSALTNDCFDAERQRPLMAVQRLSNTTFGWRSGATIDRQE